MTRASVIYSGIVVLGLSRNELYRMNPGIYFDLCQIHNNRTNPKNNNEDETG